MPVHGFICPDSERITVEECFSACRLAHELPCGRCKALPFLRKASTNRPWTGKPSVTQLLVGTREAYLKITEPYYVNPDERAFAILGSASHVILESFGQGDHLTEERLADSIVSGAFDFYDGETQTLYDYKTWGSYKIQQALGIKSVEYIVRDGETGEPLRYKTGKRVGEVKTKKVFIDGDVAIRVAAILDTSIQMSAYKYLLEDALPSGYFVKHMAVQVVARDGGLQVASQRGIEEKAPLIPINGISEHWIDRYIKMKSQALEEALRSNKRPPMCKRRETWEGRKCKQYCDVREECNNGNSEKENATD